MKLVHSITTNVFAKEDENAEKIKEVLISMFPFNLEKEKIIVEEKNAEGFSGKIKIFTIYIKKERHTNAFLENLKQKIGERQVKMILDQAESRLDEDVWFFVRLDKHNLIENDLWNVVDKGDCFHIKMKIAAFPKKREIALKVVQNIFS